MSVQKYVGARYVPKFSDVNGGVWDNTYSYESLTIVRYGNDYYTSKIPVPVGIAITDVTYWVKTGEYNGAISDLQDQIDSLDAIVNAMDLATGNGLGMNQIDSPLKYDPNGIGLTGDASVPYMQGGCYNPDRNSYVIAFISGDESKGMLVEVSTDLSTVIQRKSFTSGELRHANDMCYNPNTNRYYVAGYGENDPTFNGLIEINATDLSLVRVITLQPSLNINTIGKICYDKDNDVYYGLTNDDIYTYDASFNLIKTQPYEWVSFAGKENLFASIANNFFQSIECIDGKIAGIYTIENTGTWGCTIVMYNLDGTIFSTYPVELRVLSEIEFITKYNDGSIKLVGRSPYFLYQTEIFLQDKPVNMNGSGPFNSPVVLSGVSDINDVTIAGSYVVSSSVGVSNCAFDGAHLMYVINGYAGLMQVAFKLQGTLAIAYRFLNLNGTWRSWKSAPDVLKKGTTRSISCGMVGWTSANKKEIAAIIPIPEIDTIPLTDITVNSFMIYGGTCDSGADTPPFSANSTINVDQTTCTCSLIAMRGENHVQISIKKIDNSDIVKTAGTPITGLFSMSITVA